MTTYKFSDNVKQIYKCCDEGYIIYNIENEIKKHISINKSDIVGDICLDDQNKLEIIRGKSGKLYKTSQVANLVKNNKIILSITMKDEILNMNLMTYDNIVNDKHISEKRLVLVTKKLIGIFNYDGTTTHAFNTFCNDHGLCIFPKDVPNKLITLGTFKGEINIIDLVTSEQIKIEAHKSKIEAIAVNKNCTLVATASEKGTLIRIFNIYDKTKIHEFRRGTLSTKIFDMAFNNESSFLICCSECSTDKTQGTIHIYDLNGNNINSKSILSYVNNYVSVLKYGDDEWSAKQHYIEITEDSKILCEFGLNDTLHVINTTGKYYKVYGNNYDQIEGFDIK